MNNLDRKQIHSFLTQCKHVVSAQLAKFVKRRQIKDCIQVNKKKKEFLVM